MYFFVGNASWLRHVSAACIGRCHELRLGTAHRELKFRCRFEVVVALGNLPKWLHHGCNELAVRGAQQVPAPGLLSMSNQPASRPLCIEHMMVGWLILLYSCGEAAYGSATSGLLHMPASFPLASMPWLLHTSHSVCTAWHHRRCWPRATPTSSFTMPTGLLAWDSSWRSPHISLPVSFGVVCKACLCADHQACFLNVSWVCVGARPRGL